MQDSRETTPQHAPVVTGELAGEVVGDGTLGEVTQELGTVWACRQFK